MTQKEKIAALERDPWHAHVLKNLRQIHGDPLPDIIELGFIETIENGNVPQKQIAAWIGNYGHVGEAIASGKGSGSDFSIFWIRLYEFLAFLPKYFEFFEPLKVHLGLLKITREIRDSYSNEEQIMVEYQRNCHAHIHQTGYKIKVNYDKNGKMLDNGLFYKNHLHKVTLNQLINDELKKYKVDEKSMAIAYFKKTSGKADQLWHDLKKEFSL